MVPKIINTNLIREYCTLKNLNENYLLYNKVRIKNLFSKFESSNDLTGIYANQTPTLTTNKHWNTKILESINPLKIRELTPKEALKLMGWVDKDINKLKNIKDKDIYKVAGNSMVVQVMEYNLKKLNIKGENNE